MKKCFCKLTYGGSWEGIRNYSLHIYNHNREHVGYYHFKGCDSFHTQNLESIKNLLEDMNDLIIRNEELESLQGMRLIFGDVDKK